MGCSFTYSMVFDTGELNFILLRMILDCDNRYVLPNFYIISYEVDILIFLHFIFTVHGINTFILYLTICFSNGAEIFLLVFLFSGSSGLRADWERGVGG